MSLRQNRHIRNLSLGVHFSSPNLRRAMMDLSSVDPFGNSYRATSALEDISVESRSFSSHDEQEELRYYSGLHNLALLDLFGMSSLEQDEPPEQYPSWEDEGR